MSRVILAGVLIAMVLGSCTRRLIGSRDGLVVDSFEFQYFSGKARIQYNDGEKDLTGTANIRVQKDSAIWMSLSPGLGVEVARLYIAPDSLHFIDRINKSYLRLSFEQLSNEYDFDINYHLIESIIIGNLIYPYKRENLVTEAAGLSYQQDFENFTFRNFIGSESKKLEQLDVRDLQTKTSISVNYGQFKPVGDEIFPFTIRATLDYLTDAKNSTSITIGFNRAQIQDEPLKFPFNVPDKYKAL